MKYEKKPESDEIRDTYRRRREYGLEWDIASLELELRPGGRYYMEFERRELKERLEIAKEVRDEKRAKYSRARYSTLRSIIG